MGEEKKCFIFWFTPGTYTIAAYHCIVVAIKEVLYSLTLFEHFEKDICQKNQKLSLSNWIQWTDSIQLRASRMNTKQVSKRWSLFCVEGVPSPPPTPPTHPHLCLVVRICFVYNWQHRLIFSFVHFRISTFVLLLNLKLNLERNQYFCFKHSLFFFFFPSTSISFTTSAIISLAL